MTPSEIIHAILKRTNTTQAELAQRLGYTTQGTVSNRLNRGEMKVGTFLNMLDALGYEFVVRPKSVPSAADLEIVASKE